MRKARAKSEQPGYYHLVSRCAFKRMAFGDQEKSVFVATMRRVAAFSGIEVVAYCAMSNHFHILVHVPEQPELNEAVLLERVAMLYGGDNAESMKSQWEEYRRQGRHFRAEEEQEMLRRRMGDISPFMQCLKQRFSVWYRANHEGHEGTLWQGRFGSTFVEGGTALAAVAAYIDLNPVRARIVSDPKDYRWSSYGAAARGDKFARLCVTRIFRPEAEAPAYGAVAPGYRELLYLKGAADFDPVEIRKVIEAHGKLGLPEVLRLRVGVFTRGFAIGSKEFVNVVVREHPDNFGPRRKIGAAGTGLCLDWNGFRLCAARKLRKNPMTISA